MAGYMADMQNDSSAAVPMSVDHRFGIDINAALAKRFQQQLPLPRFVVCLMPMLQRTSSASTEILTKGLCALGACLQNLGQSSAVTSPLDTYGFPRQTQGDEDRVLTQGCDAVAPSSDAGDFDNLFATCRHW